MGIYNVVTDWKEDTTLDIHDIIFSFLGPDSNSFFQTMKNIFQKTGSELVLDDWQIILVENVGHSGWRFSSFYWHVYSCLTSVRFQVSMIMSYSIQYNKTHKEEHKEEHIIGFGFNINRAQ